MNFTTNPSLLLQQNVNQVIKQECIYLNKAKGVRRKVTSQIQALHRQPWFQNSNCWSWSILSRLISSPWKVHFSRKNPSRMEAEHRKLKRDFDPNLTLNSDILHSFPELWWKITQAEFSNQLLCHTHLPGENCPQQQIYIATMWSIVRNFSAKSDTLSLQQKISLRVKPHRCLWFPRTGAENVLS